MEDLLQIEKEYNQSEFYFREFALIRVNNGNGDDDDDDYGIANCKSFIDLQTHESKRYHVFITIDGWYAIDLQTGQKATSQNGPTFENIARKISPIFEKKWNETLIKRLTEHAAMNTESDEDSVLSE